MFAMLRALLSSLSSTTDKYMYVRYWVPLLKTLANTPKTMTFHTNCCSLQRPIVYKVAPLNPAARRRSALEVRSCVPCDQPSIRISPGVCLTTQSQVFTPSKLNHAD